MTPDSIDIPAALILAAMISVVIWGVSHAGRRW